MLLEQRLQGLPKKVADEWARQAETSEGIRQRNHERLDGPVTATADDSIGPVAADAVR